MIGVVEMVNHQRGFVAVRTATDDYSVIELLGGELEIGDVVSGALHRLGGQVLLQQGTGERISVFIQDIHASAQMARRMLAAN